MRAHFAEPFDARAYTDTGPIIERVAAKYAGLGWLGEKHLPDQFAARLLAFSRRDRHHARLEPTLAPGDRLPPIFAARARAVSTPAPRRRFPEPYVLDARRCISYLTIELRGAIPEELRPQMGSAVIGCDICQDVCPWNRKAPLTSTGRVSAAGSRSTMGIRSSLRSLSGSRRSRSRNSAPFSAAAPSSAPNGAVWFATPAWRWEIRACTGKSIVFARRSIARSPGAFRRSTHRRACPVGTGGIA